MATLEQMLSTAYDYTTKAGAQYKLPRLTIHTRKKALEFVVTVHDIESQNLPVEKSGSSILDSLVDLLELWLGRVYPDITRDQIEDDWDFADIPGLMNIIRNNEKEIENVVPPVSSAPETTN